VQHEFSDSFRHAFNTFSDDFGVFGRGVLSLRAADFVFLWLFSFYAQTACHFAPPREPSHTNQIQREFSSKVAIATQDRISNSSHPRQKTNLLKQFVLLLLQTNGGGVPSLRAADKRRAVNLAADKRRAVTSRRRKGVGGGVKATDTPQLKYLPL
jgi:hypothetical protein